MIATAAGRAPTDAQTTISRPLPGGFLFNFYLLFVVVHFLRLSSRLPFLGAIRITVLMFAVMIVALLIQRGKLTGRIDSEPTKWLVWLAAYIAVSLPFVEWPGTVMQITGQVWVLSTAFFFFTILIVDSVRRLRTLVAVVLGCQIIRVLEPLYLHATSGYWGSRTYVGSGEFMARLAGGPHDTINPNGLAFVAVTIVPFLYYLVLNAQWIGKLTKLLALGVLGATVYAMLLTSSRSGLLALGVVLLAIVMKSKTKLVLIAVIAGACVVFVGSLSDLQRDRYLSIFSSDTRGAATAEGRVEGLKDEVQLAMQRPIFGHGLGTSGEAKYHFFGRYQVAHDLYTEIVIDLGFIGLGLFLLFLRSLYRTIQDMRARIRDMSEVQSTDTRYLHALSDAVEVWALMCLFVSIAYFGLMEWHWYLIAGISVAAARVIPLMHPENFAVGSRRKQKMTRR